jgi:hypothetical protein
MSLGSYIKGRVKDRISEARKKIDEIKAPKATIQERVKRIREAGTKYGVKPTGPRTKDMMETGELYEEGAPARRGSQFDKTMANKRKKKR